MHAALLGRTVIAATSILLGAAGATPGQQPGGAPRLGVPTKFIAADGTALTVTFSGGTLEAFVQALRDSTKDPVNISLQGDAAKLRVDPLMLREVSVEAALRAVLGSRANGQSVEPDGSLVGTNLEVIQQGPEGKAVFVVTTRPMGGRLRGGPDVTVEVLSIQRLVQADEKNGTPTVPEKVVLSAIDSGLRLNHAEGEAKPEIEYHRDSGLLLVRGPVMDVRLVQEIVRRMIDDQQRRASEARQRKKVEINRNADMRRAEIALELAEQKLRGAMRVFEATEQQVKQGAAPNLSAELDVAQHRAEVGMAKIEIERLSQEAQSGFAEDSASPGGGEADQSELSKAQQRIRELESMLQQKGESATPPRGKAKSKGE